MRRSLKAKLVFLTAVCLFGLISAAIGQSIGSGWPTLHLDSRNRRVTMEEGPDIAEQNLTIHWSFEAGYGRSNPLVDSTGRIYVFGTIDGALGAFSKLFCFREALPDEETNCITPELLWATEMNCYPSSTWSTGAISPDESRFFFAGVGDNGLSLDCWDPEGNPDEDNPDEKSLLLFSSPFFNGGDGASDLIFDNLNVPDLGLTDVVIVFGNSTSTSTGYAFTYDGINVWWYGISPQDAVPSPVASSPTHCSQTYTYYDYTPGPQGGLPGSGTYWMGVGQPTTIYAGGEDGNLYAMHTITETFWSPPPAIQPPPPPPLGDPEPVTLKWSYAIGSDALVSSPVIIPRSWGFRKDPVQDNTPGPNGEIPQIHYNNVGTTTCTIYICDPAGVLYCIEDSYYEEHDWEFYGWMPSEPPMDIWIDNNDEYQTQGDPPPPPPGFPMGAYPRKYTSKLRWSYDQFTGGIHGTPILSGNILYVQDDTSITAIDLQTGMDMNTNYFGETEGTAIWSASCLDDQPPLASTGSEWNFAPGGSYSVAPSPVLDGNGLIWMVTSDGWLEVVASRDMPDRGLVMGDVAFLYIVPNEDDHHRGYSVAPFYEPMTGHAPLTMACSPIISDGTLYVRGDGQAPDPFSMSPYDTGWVLKVKENVVGRFRFNDVNPKVGYTESNRMHRVPTVFDYEVNYYDPDCSSVGVYTDDGNAVPHPENPVMLIVDGFYTFWRSDEEDLGYPPLHILPGNENPQNPPASYGFPPWGIWEGMVYQVETGDDERNLGMYEYVSDGTVSNPSLREYIYYNQNGCFNYFFEMEDGFGENAPILSEIYSGPNMCPELYFVKTAVVFDGTIARPEKSVLDIAVWYYDSDEDSPAVQDVVMEDVNYTMQSDAVIGNSAVRWEDRYSLHLTTTNDTPSFHFEFTDSPTPVHPDWPRDSVEPCTTRHPEYGQLFTLLLRDGRVTPAVGPPGEYTYSVRFFDPHRRASGINTGQIGSLNAHIYIDGEQYEMELLPGNGSQFDGLYTYKTVYNEYGEHNFRFDFYYEGQMPYYNLPRTTSVLTSDPDNVTVERNPAPAIARVEAPEFEYVGPTIAQWPSFNRYQDNNSLEGQAFGPAMPIMSDILIGEPIKGTPVIGGSESTIFVGSRDGRVYAVTPELDEIRWEFDTGDFVDCTTALGQERSLIVASRSGTIFALDSWTGEKRWIFSAANIADSSPCVGLSGDIYIGSYSGTFYSIDGRRGTLNWSYDLPTSGAVQGSAAEGTSSTVYFGSYDNNVYALNNAGLLLWSFETDGMVNSSPSVESNGNVDSVYVGSIDHSVYRLDYDFTIGAPEPDMIWKYTTGGPIQYASPGIDGEFIYVASDALYAIDKNTGELGWSYVPGGSIFGTIAVDSNGVVYFGANDARVYAVRAPVDPDYIARKEGELVWWQNVGSKIWISGVSISPDSYGHETGTRTNGYGDLYFGCWDGNLYKIADRGYNIPPVLTSPSISPTIGDSSQSFRLGIHFNDADGDEPLQQKVYIDDVPYDMVFTGIGMPSNGEYEFYTDFALSNGVHSYYFEFSDGNWAGNDPVRLPATAPEDQFDGPTIDNKPNLSDAMVDPTYGDDDQEFVFSVYFSDPDGDAPVSAMVFIDGDGHALLDPAGEGETPYDGIYTYSALGSALGVGDHTYHFEFEYSVNEWVRIPVVGERTDLTVNNAPVLETGTVSPMTGDTTGDYTYSVHYFDVDDHPPARAHVVIDGTSHEMSLYSDFDSDGTYQFVYSGELVGPGSHIYYFDFEDTEGGISLLPAPPLPPQLGPLVNATPTLSLGQVTPISGDADTEFTFSVHYSDVDGIRPGDIAMVLDGTRYTLTLEEGIITDGLYARTINGADIGLGDDHSFYFEATDDSDSHTRFPAAPGSSLSGPAIVEPGIYIPYWQVNNLSGKDTTLVIGNAGTSELSSAVDVSVHLYSGFLGSEIDTISHTIAPGEQVKIDLSDRFDDDLMRFGFAKVTWERGSIAVWAMVRNDDSQAVSMTLKDPQIRSSYLPYWEVSSESTIDTVLAVTNIGGTFVDLNIDFYDFDGDPVIATSFSIQPRVLLTLKLSEIIADPEAIGSAVLTWDRGILALWGMVVSEGSGKAFEVSFNQPFKLSADLPYWIYKRSALTRKLKEMTPVEYGFIDRGVGHALDYDVAAIPNSSPANRSDLSGQMDLGFGTGAGKLDARVSDVEVKSGHKAPPILTDYLPSPEAPTTLDRITFAVDYYDEDMDPPAIAKLVFVRDGDVISEREMTLEEGDAYDGRYSHRTFLTEDTHSYHFLFSDGETTVQLPAGSNYTLTVTAASQQLDTWLVITNLTETPGPGIVSLFGPQGSVVGLLETQLGGLYSAAMMKLSETSVLDGYGSGSISMGIANPLLNVWGIIHSDTFDTGYTLNFEALHGESMYVPYWSINDEYGVD
ncbi:MAG: PQQ-like beta-propeller repeat protein, partial [Candidatus Coatesbacteria bacterium]|nr:PQQ-like beta-propeller repeat protein [Candidatus Coatesbacteria bacterium]